MTTTKVVARKRYFVNLVLFALVMLSLGVGGTFVWLCRQEAMSLAYPKHLPIQATPADVGITTWEDVSFTTADGLRLEGWYISPLSPEDAAILFIGGHGGNRTNYLREAALLTTTQGYGALLFDLRNQGTSQGKVTTMGLLETDDVLAAFDFLSAQPEIDPERIAIYGGSMGGATAIRAMARLPQARILIADAAFESFPGVVSDGIYRVVGLSGWPFTDLIVWMTGRESGTNLFEVRPIDDIAKIAPRPILILHGTEDTVVPVQHAYRLYEAAGDPKELYIVTGGTHMGLMQLDPDGYQQHILPFLQKYL